MKEKNTNLDIEKYLLAEELDENTTKEIPRTITLKINKYQLQVFTNSRLMAGENQNLTTLVLIGTSTVYPELVFSIIYFTTDESKLGYYMFDSDINGVYTYMDYKDLPTVLEILNKGTEVNFNYLRIGEYSARQSSSNIITKFFLKKK